MTKEELAKKKGLKVTQTQKTAAESLLTIPPAEEKKPEPVVAPEPEKKAKPKKKVQETKAPEPEEKPVPVTEKETESEEQKEKTGAEEKTEAVTPKEPLAKVSFNLPKESLELAKIAAFIGFKGNLSAYIVDLIEKDINANRQTYEMIKKIKDKE